VHVAYESEASVARVYVFRDAAFLHNASPLISTPGTPAQRDAVVCTVNYQDTYHLS
jgi:hypothetical protein